MASPFKSVAQRLRSWFLLRKPRRSQRRTRFLRVEQMEERALLANIGVSIDTAGHRLLIFDTNTGAQTGLVSIPTTTQTLDAVISPKGDFAYVSDFEAKRVWSIDLASNALASGTNPISVTTFAEDLDITDDGHYLLVSDGGVGAFAVVDTTAHAQVFSGNTPGGSAIAIATQGTDVLVSSSNSPTYRYSINPASGALRYMGQFNALGGMNVTVSPYGTTALVHNAFGGGVTSILVSGMTTLDSTPSFVGTTIEATAFSPDGKRFYVRTRSTVVGFNYDPTTGQIGDTVLFTSANINPAEPIYGVDQLDATATRVYTQDGDHVLALDALTGASLGITPAVPVADASFAGVDVASNLSIFSLSPRSALINGGLFTLTVNGQGFLGDSSVQWNGVSLTTTFVDSTRLKAVVPAGNLAQPQGSVNITVVNPMSDACTSRSKVFYLDALLATAPTLTAPTSDAITFNSATLGGTVANDNGSIIQVRGILYAPTATNPNPTVGGNGVIEVGDPSASTGSFTASLAGLNPNTSYSFVAFATNNLGTTYTSSVSTFSTLAPPIPGWTFSSAYNSPISGATLGSKFSSSVPLNVTSLGMYAPYGLSASHAVGLWSSDGTLLAQTIVSGSDTLENLFRYHDLTTPLSLPTGIYFIGASYYERSEFYGLEAENFTTLPGVTFLSPAYENSGAFAFPENEDDPSFTGFFGANFLVPASQVASKTTVTATNATYDGNAHGATAVVAPAGTNGITTFQYSGIGLTTYAVTSTAPANAGTYHVVATFTPDDLDAYSPSSGSADYAIHKKAISYTIGDATQGYGSTVNLGATLGTTLYTDVNGENLNITYASTGNTVTANAGNYAITGVVSDGSGLTSNYLVTLNPGTLNVTQATLTGDATTLDALNMAKQGKLTITINNIYGLMNGDTLTSFLSTAKYYITVGANKYVFVPTTVTTAGSNITIAYTLKNSALLEELGVALNGAKSGGTAVSAGFYMESMNYKLSDDHLTRLFSTDK